MTTEELEEKLRGAAKEEQIKILRKIRAELLEEIHCKQQALDRLDYMLYEIKKNSGAI